jgi:methylenetetrahydrofolate dehydrogenase (NADP+)/methenyltetrahydrofolate cyclohydrolase
MIIDGNEIKKALVEELKTQGKPFDDTQGKKRVAFLQFGDDVASTLFVKMKMKLAAEIGVEAIHIKKEIHETTEALHALAEVVEQHYDGIVVQLPLPAGIDTELVIDSVPTEYDIDMLSEDAKVHYRNATTMRTAPVAAAVQEILWYHKIILLGKRIVVVGKGRLVGEPVAMLLDRQELPYTWIDIETPIDVRLQVLREAEVIISGTGVPHSITPDMITDGVVLIDAGTSEQRGKVAGDIDPACADKASFYTPVPGGVGPLTVVCLFKNLFV